MHGPNARRVPAVLQPGAESRARPGDVAIRVAHEQMLYVCAIAHARYPGETGGFASRGVPALA